MMILSQYHIFELDTINIYSAFSLPVRQICCCTGPSGWESIPGLLKKFTDSGSGWNFSVDPWIFKDDVTYNLFLAVSFTRFVYWTAYLVPMLWKKRMLAPLLAVRDHSNSTSAPLHISILTSTNLMWSLLPAPGSAFRLVSPKNGQFRFPPLLNRLRNTSYILVHF